LSQFPWLENTETNLIYLEEERQKYAEQKKQKELEKKIAIQDEK
jgi:hypothetical protein